jgi:ApaG protein
MSTKLPYDIHVAVKTHYIERESNPALGNYVFAYTITIENRGTVAARLLSRHWIITNGNGLVQEVKGPGVVGEQPLLQSGEGFEYTSGTMMDTPVGSMQGTYQMKAEDGHEFEAEIPAFVLALPHTLH